jgi:hypothetical protein
MAMLRSFGATLLTTLSPMYIRPSVGSSSPDIMRSAVDLPQPEGPTSTRNSLSSISRWIPLTAPVPQNFLFPYKNTTLAIFYHPVLLYLIL